MMHHNKRYWQFQVIGWLGLIALNCLIASTFNRLDWPFFQSMLITCCIGFVYTHLLRLSILRLNIMAKPLNWQVFHLILLIALTSFFFGATTEVVDHFVLKYKYGPTAKFSFRERLLISTFNSVWILVVWVLIYYFYHIFQRSRKEQLDNLRLQTVVKNLELQTIKNHINPHFIFNALNSIRALVDENPQQARSAITQLSNLLRSSLNAQHKQTVPLKDEMEIVKDYLALEEIRFEERMSVSYDLETASMEAAVPPMMLQILVENAIKHGIGKSITGGNITIRSFIENDMLNLVVQNPGTYNYDTQLNGSGFGIKSTTDRLNLLYQNRADFQIHNLANNRVESIVKIPYNSN